MVNRAVVRHQLTRNDFCAQVPQFLYEAGFGCRRFPARAGRIGVTQPRRVAAIAAAQRVAQELDCPVGSTVGYQVRAKGLQLHPSGFDTISFYSDIKWAGDLFGRLVLRPHGA